MQKIGQVMMNNLKTLSLALGIKNALPCYQNQFIRSQSTNYTFETLEVKPISKHVMNVALNRPEAMNAMNKKFWVELGECFNQLGEDPAVRSVVLSGNGKLFCAGLDLGDIGEMTALYEGKEDVARKLKKAYKYIRLYQNAISALETCLKPVVSAVHGACVGGGTNLVCAADIRYCTEDAWFQIKEVQLGICADVGVLQRLPKIIGSESLIRELALTARKWPAQEAEKFGFVTQLYKDKDSLMEGAIKVAEKIAKLSPVAVQGTKKQLVYARDYPVEQSLEYQAIWNGVMMQSEDMYKSAEAQLKKAVPEFVDL